MSTFYKKAWQLLFILFYPFITLFSLLFIGLVSLISWVSGLFTKPSAVHNSQAGVVDSGWQPHAQHHGFYLSRKPVHEVQFGPLLYRLRANPAQAALQENHWSDLAIPIGEGFLLQRWPSIAEHELEKFELVYARPGLEPPLLLHTMPTFYWQVREISHEVVEISWQEEGKEHKLVVDERELP